MGSSKTFKIHVLDLSVSYQPSKDGKGTSCLNQQSLFSNIKILQEKHKSKIWDIRAK